MSGAKRTVRDHENDILYLRAVLDNPASVSTGTDAALLSVIRVVLDLRDQLHCESRQDIYRRGR